MKIGDKIYCHSPCITRDDIESVSKDKCYTVIRVGYYNFVIFDNNKTRHEFTYDKYKKWFYTEKEYRKLKLKKLSIDR